MKGIKRVDSVAEKTRSLPGWQITSMHSPIAIASPSMCAAPDLLRRMMADDVRMVSARAFLPIQPVIMSTPTMARDRMSPPWTMVMS